MSQNSTIAKVHHFDTAAYEECKAVLTEFTGFVLAESVKPEPLTQAKLGQMLNLYIDNCISKGPVEGAKPPTGSKCEHIYTKGKNPGTKCGKSAKFTGLEGLPKCSGHKTAKPFKAKGSENSPSAKSAGKTFSYADNLGKGKTIPQDLTIIQAIIEEQQEPAKLDLIETPDGRLFHEATNIQFERREEGVVAIGLIDGPNTLPLTTKDTYVCHGNMWKWDPTKVESASMRDQKSSILIGEDNPLVQGSQELIQKKIESIQTISSTEN